MRDLLVQFIHPQQRRLRNRQTERLCCLQVDDVTAGESRVRAMLAAMSSRNQSRDFWCPVVSESVGIRLLRPGRLGAAPGYFVQCNQSECQYVDENKAPCPLHVGMFDREIRAVEADRAVRRQTEDQ
jgi:hypothetical protein